MQQITLGAPRFSRISGSPPSARDKRKEEFMKLTHSVVAIALVTFLAASGSAFGETATTPAPAATAPAAKSTAPTMDKAAISKACSQQADEKGLKGKARKHFRSKCKHNGGKGE
jgi:psiF repeat